MMNENYKRTDYIHLLLFSLFSQKIFICQHLCNEVSRNHVYLQIYGVMSVLAGMTAIWSLMYLTLERALVISKKGYRRYIMMLMIMMMMLVMMIMMMMLIMF